MANQHKHPLRGIRGIDPDLWEEFARATKADGTDRSTVVREFIRWWVGRPGAEPPRPPESRSDR